ncbi:MAG: FAD-dependent oxidoreductase, partial [Caldilineaceae bacterium]|nr:FAD-dependent oxidoreductase [Caldilineaceae bacterium]
MHHKTIVIGAGMAGIAAARTLHDAGHSVKILEARDRIGGRTHTDYSLGISNDLGAAWIHGPLANPMTALAKRFGVATQDTDFENRSGTAVMAFDADGSPIDMVEYTEGLRYFRGIYDRFFTSILYERPGDEVRSLADLLPLLLAGGEEMSDAAAKGYYYSSVIRSQYSDAADLDEIDWRLSNRYVKLPGGDLILPGGGYGRIAECLAEGLSIETGVVVERIEYGDDGVRILTDRGQELCDRAVITVPLGVLKAGNIIFSPALPAEKSAAIERIGFGNYEKLALKFPRCLWPAEPHRFCYLPGTQPELFTSWLNMTHYGGEPILVASHAGSRACLTNRWDDERIIGEALVVLRKLFDPQVPEPVAYVRTGWESDPFSQGSYSFSKVGGMLGDRRTLAEPIGDHLFFAGEATHSRYFATVHGAYETGIRAAREVMSNE